MAPEIEASCRRWIMYVFLSTEHVTFARNSWVGAGQGSQLSLSVIYDICYIPSECFWSRSLVVVYLIAPRPLPSSVHPLHSNHSGPHPALWSIVPSYQMVSTHAFPSAGNAFLLAFPSQISWDHSLSSCRSLRKHPWATEQVSASVPSTMHCSGHSLSSCVHFPLYLGSSMWAESLSFSLGIYSFSMNTYCWSHL